MKKCRVCGETKPLSEYHKNKGNKDGLATLCRACQASYQQSRKEVIADYGLKRRHGITRERYNEIFENQGRVCGLCKTDTPRTGRWCVDHDHSCCPGSVGGCGNCIRGILCDDCNLLAGQVDKLKSRNSLLQYLDGRA